MAIKVWTAVELCDVGHQQPGAGEDAQDAVGRGVLVGPDGHQEVHEGRQQPGEEDLWPLAVEADGGEDGGRVAADGGVGVEQVDRAGLQQQPDLIVVDKVAWK